MKVISKTHVGLVRENNEDALLIREPRLFAVADGMGGYAAGEVASRGALKAFEAALCELLQEQSTDITATLRAAVLRANEHICKMAQQNRDFSGMGTTLTALYFPEDGTAYACHMGDSRLYLFRNGVLTQVTHDHSYVAGLVEQGKITDQEALNHPQRHMLLQAVGMEEAGEAEIIHFALEADDLLLLCTDGLTDMVTAQEIESILAESPVEEAGDKLMEQALANGGRDNISLMLLAKDREKEEKDSGQENIK